MLNSIIVLKAGLVIWFKNIYGYNGWKSLHITYYYFYLFYLFSHLADAFVQSDLQMRATEAIKTNKRTTTCKCYNKSWLQYM